MRFKEGQTVTFLHEKGQAVFKKYTPEGKCLLIDEDGFERKCLASELTIVHKEDFGVEDQDVMLYREEAEQDNLTHNIIQQKNSIGHQRNGQLAWEIDLHIESLLDSHANLSNSEIVRRQMVAFKNFFGKARNEGVKKLFVIHGVGEGVLKHEVRKFLDNQDNVKYYDANFREYGKGATEIEVYH